MSGADETVAVEKRPGAPPARAVARLAAWLGLVGFGGGYAVIAQLRPIVVDRRRWLTDEEFVETVAIAQSLPGASGANFFTLLGLRAGASTRRRSRLHSS